MIYEISFIFVRIDLLRDKVSNPLGQKEQSSSAVKERRLYETSR